MSFIDSYLGRLRQKIGSELVLMPGAMVVPERDDGRVLLTMRADTGAWCLPAGAAETGGSFAKTAIDELADEAGLKVSVSDLIPFGCLSEAETHTITYPNEDVTHCFAMCFLVRRWVASPAPTMTSRSQFNLPSRVSCANRCTSRLFTRSVCCGSTRSAERFRWASGASRGRRA